MSAALLVNAVLGKPGWAVAIKGWAISEPAVYLIVIFSALTAVWKTHREYLMELKETHRIGAEGLEIDLTALKGKWESQRNTIKEYSGAIDSLRQSSTNLHKLHDGMRDEFRLMLESKQHDLWHLRREVEKLESKGSRDESEDESPKSPKQNLLHFKAELEDLADSARDLLILGDPDRITWETANAWRDYGRVILDRYLSPEAYSVMNGEFDEKWAIGSGVQTLRKGSSKPEPHPQFAIQYGRTWVNSQLKSISDPFMHLHANWEGQMRTRPKKKNNPSSDQSTA